MINILEGRPLFSRGQYYQCIGGPLDGAASNTGSFINVEDGNRVITKPYTLRTYAWKSHHMVNTWSVYQHESVTDQEVIDYMNKQLNLNPVEKKS